MALAGTRSGREGVLFVIMCTRMMSYKDKAANTTEASGGRVTLLRTFAGANLNTPLPPLRRDGRFYKSDHHNLRAPQRG